jgi:glycosyltransferase involved in cell wall biosynthesis
VARAARHDQHSRVHVVYLIDSLIPGGAERSLCALAPEYRRLGVQLDVAYLHERDGLAPELRAAGAELFPLAGAHGRLGWTRRAAELLRDRRPDLLHTTLFEADVVGRLASLTSRTPVVCSLVNAAYGPEQLENPALNAWKVRGAQYVDAASARRVRRFHAVSESVAGAMRRRLHIAGDKIDVIPRGRDPRQLGERSDARRTAARRSLGIPADAALVLAVGRHEYQKGFDVLLRAMAQLRTQRPDVRLVVAGRSGNVTTALETLIGELGLGGTVELLGVRDDVAELLCAADLFAFPSRWEGSPGALIEAMALEAPIVATDIAPIVEVAGDDVCARLVRPDDASALAAAMFETLAGDGRAARVAAARERFLTRFTIDRVAEEMVAFYGRALGSAP